MPVITFTHHKGGTGKTTSCLNCGGFLNTKRKRVLIIDCDPQANATTGLGCDPQDAEKNMYDIFMSGTEGFESVQLKDIIVSTDSGIDLCPSSLDLAGSEPYLYEREDRLFVLKEAIKPILRRYSYILVDTPPSMGQFVINGIVAADHVIVTLDNGMFARTGVDALQTIFSDIAEITGTPVSADIAVITRGRMLQEEMTPGEEISDGFRRLLGMKKEEHRSREQFEEIVAFCEKSFPHVFTVPYDIHVHEAQKQGLPLSQYAPDSEAAHVYEKISAVIKNWNK
ncbi:ParA family protein [Methanogenium organophilum]|uniref:AAA family ATPase n=1 Tax=Methanogenium organophilum TaxID=2199 RepID=A0A9X9S5Y0_METOG|nr:AAA family ATPase [Methanogenium organophilum]WAI01505.1 AAA family ATPase [Methanogenium organophilum]